MEPLLLSVGCDETHIPGDLAAKLLEYWYRYTKGWLLVGRFVHPCVPCVLQVTQTVPAPPVTFYRYHVSRVCPGSPGVFLPVVRVVSAEAAEDFRSFGRGRGKGSGGGEGRGGKGSGGKGLSKGRGGKGRRGNGRGKGCAIGLP